MSLLFPPLTSAVARSGHPVSKEAAPAVQAVRGSKPVQRAAAAPHQNRAPQAPRFTTGQFVPLVVKQTAKLRQVAGRIRVNLQGDGKARRISLSSTLHRENLGIGRRMNTLPAYPAAGVKPVDVDITYLNRTAKVVPSDKLFKLVFIGKDGTGRAPSPFFRDWKEVANVVVPSGAVRAELRVVTDVTFTDMDGNPFALVPPKTGLSATTVEERLLDIQLTNEPLRLGNGSVKVVRKPGQLDVVEGSVAVPVGGSIWIYRGLGPNGKGGYNRLEPLEIKDNSPFGLDAPLRTIRYQKVKRDNEYLLVYRGPLTKASKPVHVVGPSPADPRKPTVTRVISDDGQADNDAGAVLALGALAAAGYLATQGAPVLAAVAGRALTASLGRLLKQERPDQTPNPFWTTMGVLQKQDMSGKAWQSLKSELTALTRRMAGPLSSNASMFDRMRGGRITGMPPAGTPEDAIAREGRQLAADPGKAERLVKALKGVAGAGPWVAASVAMGKLLKAAGVPILNDGKPATYIAYSFTTKRSTGSAKGIYGVSPYVGYSEPNAQVSNAFISFSVTPRQDSANRIGISFSYALDPTSAIWPSAAKTEVGNVGPAPSLVLGAFGYISASRSTTGKKLAAAAKTTALQEAAARARNMSTSIPGHPGKGRVALAYGEPEFDPGFQVRLKPGSNSATEAAWAGFAQNIGLKSAWDQLLLTGNAANAALAEFTPNLAFSGGYAPSALQWTVSLKKAPAASEPKPPPVGGVVPNPPLGPAPASPRSPLTVPKPPINGPSLPNRAGFRTLTVQLAPNQSQWGPITEVQVLDRSDRVISRAPITRAGYAGGVTVQLPEGQIPDRVRVAGRHGSGKTQWYQFKLSGAGTTLFQIDRSKAGSGINTPGVPVFTDSRLGGARMLIGATETIKRQASAVFHVAVPPPAVMKPGTLQVRAWYNDPLPRHRQGVAIADQQKHVDLDPNVGIIKLAAQLGSGLKVQVRFTNKANKPVTSEVTLAKVGVRNSAASFGPTGTPRPTVYFNDYNAHTLDFSKLA